MKVISGKSFKGQRVVLDGKIFERCHFAKCRLIIEGDDVFEMRTCQIEEDCELAVEGRGRVILHMLKLMLHSNGWLSRVADNVLHSVRQPPRVPGPVAPTPPR